MRTTLAIDDDLLAAARARAAHDGKSLGEVVSALIREALTPVTPPRRHRNGVPLLPQQPGTAAITLEFVNRLRDEGGQ